MRGFVPLFSMSGFVPLFSLSGFVPLFSMSGLSAIQYDWVASYSV